MQPTIKGGNLMELPNCKHDQALDDCNYPSRASMKHAKDGCKFNGHKPCWDGCPFDDCQLSDWDMRV